jgi:hypothetical protein
MYTGKSGKDSYLHRKTASWGESSESGVSYAKVYTYISYRIIKHIFVTNLEEAYVSKMHDRNFKPLPQLIICIKYTLFRFTCFLRYA